MCQSFYRIRSILIILLIELNKFTIGNQTINQLNESTLSIHPWLPIGNFTGIIINDNSANQSYYNYNYVYNVTSDQQSTSSDKISDEIDTGDGEIETIYQKIGNNFSDKVNEVKINTNLDESSLSFPDDSPTKEEDYAGGNYGNEDDILGSEGGNGNFASQEDEEGLT